LEPEFLVVGTVADGSQVADAIVKLKPDIIFMDIYMPRLNGLDAGEQVEKKDPKVKLIFLTMTLAADVAAEAFRRGASGTLTNNRLVLNSCLQSVRSMEESLIFRRSSLRKR
jgi:DNA-binding NarL/FixJ family response regulator